MTYNEAIQIANDYERGRNNCNTPMTPRESALVRDFAGYFQQRLAEDAANVEREKKK